MSLDRSKSSKIRSFIDRPHFYPMLTVAPVTSRTNDARKVNRKAQGVPQSQSAAKPRHQGEGKK